MTTARIKPATNKKPDALRHGKPSTRSVTGFAHAIGEGVGAFVARVDAATPMQLVDAERNGVGARLIKDIAVEMNLPASRLFTIIGVPKATVEKKVADNQIIAGAGGQAVLGLIRLIGMAQRIVDNSTSPTAKGFNAAKWLGQWIERPQQALAGKRPAELLDTPTGFDIVARVLGAIESGAYL